MSYVTFPDEVMDKELLKNWHPIQPSAVSLVGTILGEKKFEYKVVLSSFYSLSIQKDDGEVIRFLASDKVMNEIERLRNKKIHLKGTIISKGDINDIRLEIMIKEALPYEKSSNPVTTVEGFLVRKPVFNEESEFILKVPNHSGFNDLIPCFSRKIHTKMGRANAGDQVLVVGELVSRNDRYAVLVEKYS